MRNGRPNTVRDCGASRRSSSAAAVLLIAAAGCADGPAETPPPSASEVSEVAPGPPPEWVLHNLGGFAYRNGQEQERNSIVESVGGGVATFDYDRDGRVDVAAAGGGTFPSPDTTAGFAAGLFRNRGGFRFDAAASQAAVDVADVYSHGLAVGDYDADGFPDVAVTGYGPLRLWRNLGDGTFAERAEAAGLDDRLWGTSAAFADLDGDAVLDLFVTHYVDWSPENDPRCRGRDGVADVCPPRSFRGLPDTLFVGDGRGGFDARPPMLDGKGLGVVLGDVDGDGDLDIYVGNDSTPNHLYVNDGSGRFTEDGLLRGVAVDDAGHPDGSMGVDLGDFDGDGLPDLWAANYESEAFALYRNLGAGAFQYASGGTGVSSIGDLFVGFGTAFEDVDGDADLDILVSNGHVVQTERQSPIRQRPLLLENLGGRFRPADYEDGYFADAHIGRGLATGDLDGDGDADLVVSHNNDPVAVLENRAAAGGSALAVRLVGVDSPREGIGAALTLRTPSGDQRRQVLAGGSYLSSRDPEVRFFWPDRGQTAELTVRWPSGLRQTVDVPAGRSRAALVEGRPGVEFSGL